MRKTIRYILILTIAAGLSFMIYKIINKIDEKKQKETQRQVLPDFEFFTLDSVPYRKSDILSGHSILIIYFNPDCDQCDYEAKEIKANINKFYNTQILMISNSISDNIRIFADKFNLTEEPSVRFLMDTKGLYYQIFDARNTPNIFIYNKDHQLLKHYEGQTKIEAILKHLSNEN